MTLSSKDIKRVIEKHGFVLSRQKGSHQQFVGFVHGKKHRVTVIANQKNFAPGTLRSIPDFSTEKSALSASEGPRGQIRREFVLLRGVSQILRLHKMVRRKIRDYLASRQNPDRILSCNPFGANFAIAKFGMIRQLGLSEEKFVSQ